VVLGKEEKKELKQLAKSASLRKDMKQVGANRYNPFVVNGQVDIDRWITFLTEYNEFINHAGKPFHPMVEKDIKL
jgi:hypothetical protein